MVNLHVDKMLRLIIIFFLIGFGVMGCATIKVEEETFIKDTPEPEQVGVYHKVKKGETIWRIAQSYGVSIENIISSNQIPNAAQVEENQLLFIPGAGTIIDIPMVQQKETDSFLWPIDGKVISHFHEFKNGQLNKGIDIEVPNGQEIKAARTGQVVFADYLVGFGYTAILDHADGLYSVYANNRQLLIAHGDRIHQNDVIARAGGPQGMAYLHFQIRKNSIEQNPLHYLP